MRVGGPPGLSQAVKAEGGQPGPLVQWYGAWTPKTGYGAVDNGCSLAKAAGVPFLAHLWYGGDQLNRDYLYKPEGTWDPGQKVMKTKAQGLAFMAECSKRINASGVE